MNDKITALIAVLRDAIEDGGAYDLSPYDMDALAMLLDDYERLAAKESEAK